MSQKFKQSFCHYVQGPEEHFERHLFRHGLHRISLPVSLILFWINPQFFELDLLLIRRLGVSTSRRQFRGEIENYRRNLRRSGNVLKRRLLLRVSGERLLQFEGLLSD